MPRKQCTLLCSIRKSILPLNNSLPKSFTCIWTTAEELYNRLVVAGVKSALTPVMVADALRLHNTDECFMTKSEHNHVPYYWSNTADLADLTNIGPCKQRFKKLSTGRKHRTNRRPTKYFINAGNRHFKIINNVLFKLGEKEKERINQQRRKGDNVIHIVLIPYWEYTNTVDLCTKMPLWKQNRYMYKQRCMWDGRVRTLRKMMVNAWCRCQGWRILYDLQLPIFPTAENN